MEHQIKIHNQEILDMSSDLGSDDDALIINNIIKKNKNIGES